MIRTTRTRARRKRPDLFPGFVSQADRRNQRLSRLDEIRNRWWKAGDRTCGICGKPIGERLAYTLDHIVPGTYKSDDEINLQPAHWLCNYEKGSKRGFRK